MTPIRVVLADDHTLVRAGIRAMFEGLNGVEVVGEARNGREAIELVERLQPNILMTDISMPEMNGLEVTTRVTKAFPAVRVIIVSMHTSEEYVWQALRSGAAGYLLKDTDVREIELAVRTVATGESYLTPSVSKQSVESYLQRLGSETVPAEILTPRQREVLQAIAEGKTTKEIARVLGISPKTVESHRVQLMERLNLFDIPSLVRYAVHAGMVPPAT